MRYYTYFHTRNDTGTVFYIGKGSNNRYKSLENRNKHWSNIVNKCGFEPHIAAYWQTEKDAFDHEKFLILCYKDLGLDITNVTSGGDGVDSETAKVICERMRREGRGLFSLTKEQKTALAIFIGKKGGRARALSGDLQKLGKEHGYKGGIAGGPKAASITNAQRYKCLTCGMITTPGNIAKHQIASKHNGKERIL